MITAVSSPDAMLTCQQLQQAFMTAAASLDNSCGGNGDCAGIGGKSLQTCDCAAALYEYAVNGAAYQGSQAEAIANQFYAQCANETSVFGGCDESPVFTSCSNQHCLLQVQSCLGPDAGP